jgi:hypothetical protein
MAGLFVKGGVLLSKGDIEILEETVSDPLEDEDVNGDPLKEEADGDPLGTVEKVEWMLSETDAVLEEVLRGVKLMAFDAVPDTDELAVNESTVVPVIVALTVLEYDSSGLCVIVLADVLEIEGDAVDERLPLGLTEGLVVLTDVRVLEMHAE